jgi:hypothetical protein
LEVVEIIATIIGVSHPLHPDGSRMNRLLKVGFVTQAVKSARFIGLDEVRKQDWAGEWEPNRRESEFLKIKGELNEFATLNVSKSHRIDRSG